MCSFINLWACFVSFMEDLVNEAKRDCMHYKVSFQKSNYYIPK